MKLLGIQVLNQADGKWGNLKLGTSTIATIKSDGCLLTDVCMVCNYYGKNITPDILNSQLIQKKGFVNGANLVYGVISEIYPDITVDWDNFIDCSTVDAPLDKIDNILISKRPVIVKVDYDTNSAKIEQHWITIIGKTDDGSYICNDPIDGTEIFFQARYGDPKRYIFKIVVYNGKIPETQANPQDEINKLMEQLKVCNETLSAKSQELAVCLEALQKAKDKADSFEELYNTTKIERDEAVTLQGKADRTVKDLQERLDVLQHDYDTLRIDYNGLRSKKLSTFSKWDLFKAIIGR